MTIVTVVINPTHICNVYKERHCQHLLSNSHYRMATSLSLSGAQNPRQRRVQVLVVTMYPSVIMTDRVQVNDRRRASIFVINPIEPPGLSSPSKIQAQWRGSRLQFMVSVAYVATRIWLGWDSNDRRWNSSITTFTHDPELHPTVIRDGHNWTNAMPREL